MKIKPNSTVMLASNVDLQYRLVNGQLVNIEHNGIDGKVNVSKYCSKIDGNTANIKKKKIQGNES